MWAIDYLKEDGIVFVKPSGPLKLEQIKQLSEKAYSISKEKDSHRILVDNRGIDITLSVLEIDKIPDIIKIIGATPSDKIAILYQASSLKIGLLNFLRNSLYLKSIQMRIFGEPAKAIAWLKYEDGDRKAN
jgi:hypothetical protein